ncbi:MAG: hypothetical protein HF976_08145 [ANME-2 cluster archaeon]|nr:hypothetical protein [ANME-2 cluster archaeon]MBC2708425.1 hypothetical protein [ANME-2 cluster archaeon]MBC2745680.1 hypothetical protein [ANME-2 cluster archaeon]
MLLSSALMPSVTESWISLGPMDQALGDALLGIARPMYYPDRTYAAMVRNSVDQGLIPEMSRILSLTT